MKSATILALAASLALLSPLHAKGQSGGRKSQIPTRRAVPVEPVPVSRALPVVSADDEARFLAGLPVAGPLEPLTQTAVWQNHAADFNAAWQRMEMRQLGKVRLWAHGVPQGDTVFYFFSGPDFLYADLLFPRASTYILCAIEPVGRISDLRMLGEPGLADALGNLRRSMNTMLKFHYFITKDLRADLAHPQVGGTLPILYAFLARNGHTIRAVTPIANGVKITFSGGAGGTKTLYYFRTDLSNGAQSASFFNFCRRFRDTTALLKSASYLLHREEFSRCHDFLLQHSNAIVQDDSGIPYRAFDPSRWTLRFFGTYRGTRGEFAKYHQPDLLEAYRQTVPAPLPFAFGYEWSQEKGTLMIATKR